MASIAQQMSIGGALRYPPKPATRTRRTSSSSSSFKVCAKRGLDDTRVMTSLPEIRERLALREKFRLVTDDCNVYPTEGVKFGIEDFYESFGTCKEEVVLEMGSMVTATVVHIDEEGASLDLVGAIGFLPMEEACLPNVFHIAQTGIAPGFREEFEIVGETNDGLVLSLNTIQHDLAWERCQQLLAEEATVKGKIIGANKGGVVALVEGLRGFVPFSQISSTSTDEELIDKELFLKFVEVDEEEARLVLSQRKAMAGTQAQYAIGTTALGTVQSLKPYGAFIDIGGINGLLHVSQISHDRVSDIATVLQPGDTLKVMILSHDRERGRVSLSTKKLEPTPGDMIRNPKLVYEKAEEMALTFRQRIAQAEALARADMVRFNPNKDGGGLTLTEDGILSPFDSDLPAEGLNLGDFPPAV